MNVRAKTNLLSNVPFFLKGTIYLPDFMRRREAIHLHILWSTLFTPFLLKVVIC